MNKDNKPEAEKQWSVYILECSDKSYYTGITNDINKRLKAHNSKLASKYTRTRLPVKQAYVKNGLSHSEAAKLEHKIKQLTRKQKIELINAHQS